MEYYEITLNIPIVDWLKILQWYFWGSILSAIGIMYMNLKNAINGTYSTKRYSMKFELVVLIVLIIAYPLIWLALLLDDRN